MKVSYNWLKEFLDAAPAPRELARALTMTGTEVESLVESGGTLNNVVVAEIVSCSQHPNADRLKLCEVKTATDKYSIVCGASNMKAGDRVALALIGAELPGGVKIKKSKIRGVESQGMMCSEVELGIKDTSDGILILSPDAPLGANINDALSLGDALMEIGVTPNRSDLLSVRGIAREASAVTDARLKEKTFAVVEGARETEEIVSVSIEDGAPCKRYMARVIEGVAIGAAPEYMRQRLEAHGIRSINNVVDVTNYVLLELGQPLHAFDLDKIEGRSIDVRLAGENEKIETIDGKARALDPSMLVIADANGPAAIAGVMGGKYSEVTEATKNILLESAWFEPSSVRKTARKTGLSSESSYRFERGVDIESVPLALDYAAYLIKELSGGTIARERIDVYVNTLVPAPIKLRLERANAIIGVDVEAKAAGYLKRLGLDVEEAGEGALVVTPPPYRSDLKEEIDLIEEIARLNGYDNIPAALPSALLKSGDAGKATRIKRAVKGILTSAGFNEVLNYSFVSQKAFDMAGGKDGVQLSNPLTEEMVVMRQSLIPSLLDNLVRNLLQKNDEVRVFEVAPVFLPGGKLPVEDWRVVGLMYGLRNGEAWNLPKEWVDFYDVKGVVEGIFEGLGLEGSFEVGPVTIDDLRLFHPGKSAAIMINGKRGGVFGELHPELKLKLDLKRPAYLFDADLSLLSDLQANKKAYRPLPKFPESGRDIAFVVDVQTPYNEIISVISSLDTKLIERVELFDVYCGGTIPPSKKSLALRITYRSMERTLVSDEIEAIHGRVRDEIVKRFGAEVRGEQ
ncbi:MAG: phenylalanine--tRNA ligase subunit beta [Deltaproteobacteria bacterium GWB2_55_19]|nr:MAG: phenylalanine--tRNA ligase subunit beta [Deltaproteobacteria bacterium GWB2_55_19]